ncbi:hypothetical protein SCJ67_000992 [Escherichia coli]|nr:hypothetical protein [Escherichia coli]EES3539875.1 hypothetical protein [Escherichia coli]EET2843395.1 hypothetical protein [Escherichia coli]EET3444560.1 hypothetical protein [Escherichia coli]EFC6203141.1 hypothetical protein [Escherichia coli]
MSEGLGGPQGATAGGTLEMRMLSQQAMVASQMKRAANDKAIAQMLAAKKSGPPAARLGDEIQHKSFLGALAVGRAGGDSDHRRRLPDYGRLRHRPLCAGSGACADVCQL